MIIKGGRGLERSLLFSQMFMFPMELDGAENRENRQGNSFKGLRDIWRKKQQTPKSDHFKYIYLTLRVRIGNSPVNWIGKFLILALNLVGGPLDFRFRFRVRFREIFGSFDHQNLGLNRSNMLKNIPEMKATDFLTGVFTSGKYWNACEVPFDTQL